MKNVILDYYLLQALNFIESTKRKLELEFDADAVTFMDAFGLPIPPRRIAPKRFLLNISDAPVYFTGGRLAK